MLLSSVNLPVIAIAEETAGPVICGKEAHEHTEACYAPVLTCGEEERDAVTETVRVFAPQYTVHQHTEACYNAKDEVQCGYVAGEYYHTHNQYCKNEAGELVCGLESKRPHEHTDACYTETKELICESTEEEGHTHTDECYTVNRELTCEHATRRIMISPSTSLIVPPIIS